MRRSKRQKPPPMEALVSNYLPETIYEILLRLPSKSLLRFKCVCKSWNALISDPQFIQSHHSLSITSTHGTKVFSRLEYGRCFSTLYAEDHKIHVDHLYFPPRNHNALVLGSCHGLVLLKEHSRENFYLWNPSIRKYAKFPCPFNCPTQSEGGLCYDSSSDDYKVIAIYENIKNYYRIYSLRKGCWGKREVFPYREISISPSVFADGIVHWVRKNAVRDSDGVLVTKNIKGEEDYEYDRSNTYEIICFNPTEETFSIVPKPELVGDGYVFSLTVLRGSLGLHCYNLSKSMMKIWLRTGQDYMDASCWVEFMIISNIPTSITVCSGSEVRPLCYTQENDIVVCVDGRGFYLYNIREKKFRERSERSYGSYSGPLTTVMYVDSLL